MKKQYKQKITLETQGSWASTHLFIDGKEIYCTSINVSGNQSPNIYFVIALTESNVTKAEIKSTILSPAMGFIGENDTDDDDLEYEDE
jgi:hypothetical protein